MKDDSNERRRMIGVALGVKTVAEAVDALPRVAATADAAELRLDFFEESYDLERLLSDRPLPVIVTNRPPREGGRCHLPESARLAVLRRAGELGADYLDLESDAASPEVVDSLKDTGARIVISRHSFGGMPNDLLAWADEMAERGADVIKVVGMAHDARDILPVCRVFYHVDRPTIAIAMGDAGLASRVLALRYDRCFLTFATLDSGAQTAPGQIPVADLHAVYRARRLGPTSEVFGVLGTGVSREVLAEHNARFAAKGRSAVVVPIQPSAPAPEILAAFRELPVAGWQILEEADQTAAVNGVDDLGELARRKGKVNIVRVEGERLRGEWDSDPQFSLWD